MSADVDTLVEKGISAGASEAEIERFFPSGLEAMLSPEYNVRFGWNPIEKLYDGVVEQPEPFHAVVFTVHVDRKGRFVRFESRDDFLLP